MQEVSHMTTSTPHSEKQKFQLVLGGCISLQGPSLLDNVDGEEITRGMGFLEQAFEW
jgi:hypothetical protein